MYVQFGQYPGDIRDLHTYVVIHSIDEVPNHNNNELFHTITLSSGEQLVLEEKHMGYR